MTTFVPVMRAVSRECAARRQQPDEGKLLTKDQNAMLGIDPRPRSFGAKRRLVFDHDGTPSLFTAGGNLKDDTWFERTTRDPSGTLGKRDVEGSLSIGVPSREDEPVDP
jgi:hypothetical protein